MSRSLGAVAVAVAVASGPTAVEAEEPPLSTGHVVVLLPASTELAPERLGQYLAGRVEDLGYAVTVAPAPAGVDLGGEVDAARLAGTRFSADAVVWLHRLADTRLLVFLSEGDDERIIARDLDTAGASEDDALEALAIIVRSVLRAHVTLTQPPPEPAPEEPAEPPATPGGGGAEEEEPEETADAEGGEETPEEPSRRAPVAWPRGGVALLLQGLDGDTGATLVGGYVGVDLRITDLLRIGIAAWILPAVEVTSEADLTLTVTRVPIEVTGLALWQISNFWLGPRIGVVLDPVSARSSTQVREDSFEVGVVAAACARYRLVDRIWIEAEVGVDLFFTEHTWIDPAVAPPELLVYPFAQPRFALGIAIDIP